MNAHQNAIVSESARRQVRLGSIPHINPRVNRVTLLLAQVIDEVQAQHKAPSNPGNPADKDHYAKLAEHTFNVSRATEALIEAALRCEHAITSEMPVPEVRCQAAPACRCYRG